MTISRQRIQDRIAASILVNGSGCWLWQKTKIPGGYGSFALGGGKNIGAHRASYQAFVGDIPNGIDVCHHCDVRHCVNHQHLFLGTRSDNIRDAAQKNRVSRTHQKKGADHPSSKLNDTKVADILARLAKQESKRSIARRYGVTDRVVLLISRGQLWKHVSREAA